MKKIFGILLFFYGTLFADFQKVKVGFIDPSFDITKVQVEQLLRTIEKELEAQIGLNLFDYDPEGKPIDFIYMAPSQKKQNIQSSINKLQRSFSQIEQFAKRLTQKRQKVLEKEKDVVERKKSLDRQIVQLNNKIDQFNNLKKTNEKEFHSSKKRLETEQKKLQTRINKWNQANRNYEVYLNAYNQQVIDYRLRVKSYNRLQRALETLVRTSPEIQGAAKGYKKVVYNSFEKDGNIFIDKKQTTIMEKIEIYGFESLAHLKAILAHELLHLVGIGHTQSKGALMNPILQENQVQYLQLNSADIKIIKEVF